MPSKVYSAANVGLDAKLVEIEVDVSHGLRSFSIVGLPDKAVKEAEERVDAAIKSTKLLSPHSRTFKVIVNLAPADLKKEGSLYDLPIALAFLISTKQTSFDADKKMFLGELSLDGRLREAKGVLPFAILAKDMGFKEIILPVKNAKEAALIKDLKIIGVESLSEALAYLENRQQIEPLLLNEDDFAKDPENFIDISWVKGQEYAKRALEITAAGGHNLFFFGPPGGGKSLLAKSLPSILPKLTREESLEVTKIYSVAGLLGNEILITQRPFRSPHHVVSDVALTGGGNPPRPGEITLAHRGVLFLDEFPEFHRDVLESLRQPIEEGQITISRSKYNFTFPSRFMMVGASNPCPCGYLNSPDKPCTCSPSQVAMYRRKLSGPLMDRIDIFIEVPAVKYEKLVSQSPDNQSKALRDKIGKARLVQKERFSAEDRSASGGKGNTILTNSEMNIEQIKKYCQYDLESQSILKKYVDSGKLSARGYHRVLKVSRTIADLAQSENIEKEHIAEALMYRLKD